MQIAHSMASYEAAASSNRPNTAKLSRLGNQRRRRLAWRRALVCLQRLLRNTWCQLVVISSSMWHVITRPAKSSLHTLHHQPKETDNDRSLPHPCSSKCPCKISSWCFRSRCKWSKLINKNNRHNNLQRLKYCRAGQNRIWQCPCLLVCHLLPLTNPLLTQRS